MVKETFEEFLNRIKTIDCLTYDELARWHWDLATQHEHEIEYYKSKLEPNDKDSKEEFNEEELALRYQYCSWYIKLWRCRYLLPVPFFTLYYWLRQMFKVSKEERCSFGLILSINKGNADFMMKYYYTIDEIKENLKLNRPKSL